MTASLRLALIATASVAATLSFAVPAHADYNNIQFLSPSANIRCQIENDDDGTAFAVCKIRDHTWEAKPVEYCQQASVPGATGGPGSDLQLGKGSPPCVGPHTIQIFYSGPDAPPVLDYGQTRTFGAISCKSEPSGVTCSDSSSGHFFRISRDSYQLG
ncbi:MAG TPA: hypothetical protein VMS92_01575 [Mycobacterium sp.]|nr:hypothetical protein [Mycobacterium sp.]